MTDTNTEHSGRQQAVGVPVEQPVMPPMRALCLTMRLQADSLPRLVWELRSMADQIDRDEMTVGVSAGSFSGSIYELLHDPAQTHDKYFSDLQAYLAAKRAAANRI